MVDRGPVLTARQRNRAVLARQMLLEPASVPLPSAVDRMGGVQNQYAPAGYVALWSRLSGFRRDDLTRALEARSVVQGTLLRATIHLVSAPDYWPAALAVREERRRWWLRVTANRSTEPELVAAAGMLRRRLADGPLRRAEIEQLLGRDLMTGVGLWLDLVRVPPSGTWERRRADLYAAAADWLGGPGDEVDPLDAAAHLARRYLAAFGPAPARSLASWAGMRISLVRRALDRLELRRFRDESGGELLDLPDAPLPDPDTPAPIRFLPVYDATLLAHGRHAGMLPEEFRDRVFSTRNPQSESTFLVDGAVAGAWSYRGGKIALEPFRALDAGTMRELREAAEPLRAFHAEPGDALVPPR